jgi:NADPH:quinone reductase-like Zn-dependent oxidoreductase
MRNVIVHRGHYHRENNEVVELLIAHQSITELMFLRLSQKGSLLLTRPILFHCIASRDALEACAKELFEAVASADVRINVNQRFALKEPADAHNALEGRATSGSTILTI